MRQCPQCFLAVTEGFKVCPKCGATVAMRHKAEPLIHRPMAAADGFSESERGAVWTAAMVVASITLLAGIIFSYTTLVGG